MFTKFKITKTAIRSLMDEVGKINLLDQTKTRENFYNDILKYSTGEDGIIDGSKLQSLNLPSISKEYDLFISYSHNDEEYALFLASWLNNYCGLSCFLDSTIWHSANALLKVIDDEYCYQPDSKTYNYSKRNFSTSHIHAMLTMAMHDVINRSECCIAIDSDQSYPIKNGIETCTLSPWIYEEVAFITQMKPTLPTRYSNFTLRLFSDGGQICEAREQRELKVKYNVNLNDFPSLSITDLKTLQQGKKGLDQVYKDKRILRLQLFS